MNHSLLHSLAALPRLALHKPWHHTGLAQGGADRRRAKLGRTGQQGLSLLELLVAFAIMAMALGLLYRSMGSSARNVADMATQQQAVMVAQSLLHSRDTVPAAGWNEQGTSPPSLSWSVESAPYTQGLEPGSAPPAGTGTMTAVLHQVRITVRWEDGVRPQQLQVYTLLPQAAPRAGEVLR